MERKNINRGFKKLRVWQDAVCLYVLTCSLLKKFPFEFKKVISNCIDASQSISRNIAEGYCRRSLKEYLVHLNYALGSCGVALLLRNIQASKPNFKRRLRKFGSASL